MSKLVKKGEVLRAGLLFSYVSIYKEKSSSSKSEELNQETTVKSSGIGIILKIKLTTSWLYFSKLQI